MPPFRRRNPAFSLCGLNCALCPRHWTDGASRCPGCGGEGFSDVHPTCAVATCNTRHDSVEHCFECSKYPCARYADAGSRDSFITYRNVASDMERAKVDLEGYHRSLSRKAVILRELLEGFDDGRRKSFLCLAVNLLPSKALETAMTAIRERRSGVAKEDAAMAAAVLMEAAGRECVELKLRK